MLQVSVFLTEVADIVGNEFARVQCTTHSAVIPFYRLTDRFISKNAVSY
jgi:hypothetical protein